MINGRLKVTAAPLSLRSRRVALLPRIRTYNVIPREKKKAGDSVARTTCGCVKTDAIRRDIS